VISVLLASRAAHAQSASETSEYLKAKLALCWTTPYPPALQGEKGILLAEGVSYYKNNPSNTWVSKVTQFEWDDVTQVVRSGKEVKVVVDSAKGWKDNPFSAPPCGYRMSIEEIYAKAGVFPKWNGKPEGYCPESVQGPFLLTWSASPCSEEDLERIRKGVEHMATLNGASLVKELF
jgi:hypothetical protein